MGVQLVTTISKLDWNEIVSLFVRAECVCLCAIYNMH